APDARQRFTNTCPFTGGDLTGNGRKRSGGSSLANTGPFARRTITGSGGTASNGLATPPFANTGSGMPFLEKQK
ncbi:hypothetical protein PMAYCL1PPCAC_26377, partial [Pristionchus mayeri]